MADIIIEKYCKNYTRLCYRNTKISSKELEKASKINTSLATYKEGLEQITSICDKTMGPRTR